MCKSLNRAETVTGEMKTKEWNVTNLNLKAAQFTGYCIM